MSKLLTDHDEIRAWVSARAGSPAQVSVPDGHGGFHTNLRLVFGQRLFATDNDESRDQLGGVEPVSWAEWFETFENEKLALRVSTPEDNWHEDAFEFDKRGE